MINTLRITGVIAVLLAGVLFVFPVVFGVRSDQKVNEFLGSPGARERFEKAADNKAQNKEDRTSPLVQQAEAFALYLNPSKPASGAGPKSEKTAGLLPPPGVSPKFKVFATTYFPDNPEMSRALIDEPGRGRHWVNQSNAVGHLVIAQVKDGIVVVKNNGETYEVAVEKNPAPAAATPASAAVSMVPTSRDAASRSRAVPPAAANMPPLTTPAVAGVIPQPPASPERDAKLQELARQLIDVQRKSASSSSGAALSDAEKTARAQELIAKYREAQRSVRVSPKEAKELGALGEESQQTQGEPNAPAATTGDSKIEAGSSDPNGSAGNPAP